jgi:hypothetical protein
MAYATNREDLLDSVNPEQLNASFEQWHTWLYEEGSYLGPSATTWRWTIDKDEQEGQEGYMPFVLDKTSLPLTVRPANPFPDWKGPACPSASELRTME